MDVCISVKYIVLFDSEDGHNAYIKKHAFSWFKASKLSSN